jgi:hypothetical protein
MRTDPSGEALVSKLKPCPRGMTATNGSVTKCNAKGMGMKSMWCSAVICKVRTCDCSKLSSLVGGKFVAFGGPKSPWKPRCGDNLQVFNRITGVLVDVVVIDKGPYANNAGIDLNDNLFGYPVKSITSLKANTWPVCVSNKKTGSNSQLTKICPS